MNAADTIDKSVDDDLKARLAFLVGDDYHCASCARRGCDGWAPFCWVNHPGGLLARRICWACRLRLSNVWLIDSDERRR
jgi:hypothetical protein